MTGQWRIVVGVMSLVLSLAGMNAPVVMRLRGPAGGTNSAWLMATRGANLAGVLLLALTLGLGIYLLGRAQPG